MSGCRWCGEPCGLGYEGIMCSKHAPSRPCTPPCPGCGSSGYCLDMCPIPEPEPPSYDLGEPTPPATVPTDPYCTHTTDESVCQDCMRRAIRESVNGPVDIGGGRIISTPSWPADQCPECGQQGWTPGGVRTTAPTGEVTAKKACGCGLAWRFQEEAADGICVVCVSNPVALMDRFTEERDARKAAEAELAALRLERDKLLDGFKAGLKEIHRLRSILDTPKTGDGS